MKRIISALAACTLLSFLPVRSAAQGDAGLGLGLSPDALQLEKKNKRLKPVDPFTITLARHFGQQQEDIAKLAARGYGRNELIKLLLISRKSGTDLRAVVRARERKMRLSAIAAQHNVDYATLLSEAETVRRQIDFEVPRSSSTGMFEMRTSSGIVIISSSVAPSAADR
jgi:hypothetical protein